LLYDQQKDYCYRSIGLMSSEIHCGKNGGHLKKLTILVVLLIAISHIAEAAASNSGSVQSFKAGGVAISIPSPSRGFVEAGDRRSLMELFVPQTNRLLSAYMTPEDLARLNKGGDNTLLSKYGLVEVARRAEFMDCGANDFKEVINGAKEAMGDVSSTSVKDTEEEFNRRMKALDIPNARVSIGKPLMLGTLFSKPDEYGFGMITEYAMSGNNVKVVAGCAMLRVKNRLLFAYLYAEYKDEDTIKWIRKTTEEWSDAILKANK
jgi:hypothetical protein